MRLHVEMVFVFLGTVISYNLGLVIYSILCARAPEHAPPGDAAMEDMTKATAEELTGMV